MSRLSHSAESAVSLRGVSKSYGGRPVVSDLSLEVAAGEFLAIVGPSGSGKTTVMRVIGGFEAPDAGSVRIAGEDVTFEPPERRRVNTVFQSYALFPHMSVIENVAYGPRMRGLSRRDRRAKAADFLDLVRLAETAERYPHELSGGMQQRVALARALANEPDVLLLDEPLGALDRKLRDEMQRELRRVQSELKATFIYVTHDQEEAFGMADRLAVMRNGGFEQIGAPAEIYDRPASGWISLFVGTANTIPGRVERIGDAVRLASDFGAIEVGYLAPDLAPGNPRSRRRSPRGDALRTGRRGISASREPHSRRARRRGRHRTVAAPARRHRRRAHLRIDRAAAGRRFRGHAALADAPPGTPIVVTFDPASARAYRAE